MNLENTFPRKSTRNSTTPSLNLTCKNQTEARCSKPNIRRRVGDAIRFYHGALKVVVQFSLILSTIHGSRSRIFARRPCFGRLLRKRWAENGMLAKLHRIIISEGLARVAKCTCILRGSNLESNPFKSNCRNTWSRPEPSVDPLRNFFPRPRVKTSDQPSSLRTVIIIINCRLLYKFIFSWTVPMKWNLNKDLLYLLKIIISVRI